MKQANKFKLIALLTPLASVSSFAQSVADRQSAIESQATRITAPTIEDKLKTDASSSGSTSSDVGLQRVVSKKESNFSVDAGSSFNYMYRSNPLSTNGKLSAFVKSGVYEATAFASFGYDNYEAFNGVFTPRVGFSISSVRHTQSQLDFADYRTQKVYLQGDLSYESGWSIAPLLECSNIVSSKYGTEDYKEFYPSITLGKTWEIDKKSVLRTYCTTGYHFSEVDDLGGTVPSVTANRLDNWTNNIGASYYRNLMFNVQGQVYAELSDRNFANGQNRARTDITETVGSALSYTWKVLRASVFANYTNRSSNEIINEYKNYDIGANVSVVFRF